MPEAAMVRFMASSVFVISLPDKLSTPPYLGISAVGAATSFCVGSCVGVVFVGVVVGVVVVGVVVVVAAGPHATTTRDSTIRTLISIQGIFIVIHIPPI